ncbi:MAG: DUF4260 domain-containing protein [Gemmatimonadetes bacterium]|nr:DUF4260 domain-containing protein [Gemmatimonadota bacterium]
MRSWLRLEGLAVFVLAVVLYHSAAHPWSLFAILFLVPDVSFAAYLAGPRVGATVYNLLHSYAGPVGLGIALVLTGNAVAVPLIWSAHIGFDRALGYGLKYPSAFNHTHLGAIGRAGHAPPPG